VDTPASGTVTFLLTDIEGSTLLLEQLGPAWGATLNTHHELLRSAIEGAGGQRVNMNGDAVFAVFARSRDAVAAAAAAQRALAATQWPEGVRLRVRMGLHTGEAERAGQDYVGLDVRRAARICAAAHGGQVLLSSATHVLTERMLPEGVRLRDLGEHRLEDLSQAERLHQLCIDGLPAGFPAPRTLDAWRDAPPAQPTTFIGRERELPAARTPLLGREHDVTAALDLLRRRDVRLLTLTGPGGVGKTRLALEVAREARDEFTDGVCFVPLGAVDDPALVASTVARFLGVSDAGGLPAREQLELYLHDRELLLVLDGFERVVEAALLVAELLESCPALKGLVSSRAVLHLSGEHELAVLPLAVPRLRRDPVDSEALAVFPAVTLFVQRAQAARADFRLSAENAGAVAELCARLDGLPLAIELAAARVKLLEPKTMVARLGSRLQLLTGGPRDLPERQRTLRDTITWSYDLLAADEKRLFRLLAVFVDGCTLDAAAAVSDAAAGIDADLFETIAALVDESMLLRLETGGEPRFGMLETMQEYGADRLMAVGEEPTVRRAHAAHFLALADDAERHLRGPEQSSWLERLEGELGNLRAALRWFLDGGEPEAALRLGRLLGRFWYVRGHLAEGRRWLEEALESARADSVERAHALQIAAMFANYVGDLDRAEVLAGEGLALSRELGDERGIAGSLTARGLAARQRGRYKESRLAFEESIAICRRLGEGPMLGEALARLAATALTEGGFPAGVVASRESLELYRKLGDHDGVAYSLCTLGLALFRQGAAAEGERILADALAAGRAVGNRRYSSRALLGLGLVALSKGDHRASRGLLEEATEIAIEFGDLWFVLQTLPCLATVLCAEGHPESAVVLLSAAEAQREAIGAGVSPWLTDDCERTVTAARAALEAESFSAAWSRGGVMNVEEALAAVREVTREEPEGAHDGAGLSAREAEILRLVARGMTDAEVADELVVSRRTVHAHLRSVYRKLDVRTRVAATRYAVEHGLG
jgi:predicted ATPase/class 3 adenylate cyclase/DNA-binding NarL/FixJ family response regulator